MELKAIEILSTPRKSNIGMTDTVSQAIRIYSFSGVQKVTIMRTRHPRAPLISAW